jgi:hypothetical protein
MQRLMDRFSTIRPSEIRSSESMAPTFNSSGTTARSMIGPSRPSVGEHPDPHPKARCWPVDAAADHRTILDDLVDLTALV